VPDGSAIVEHSVYLVAGESLIDLVPTADGLFQPVAGGAPYNFARALALQEMAAAYLNPFSEDAFGTLLRTRLEAAGAQHWGPASPKPTSLALVATDAQGAARYSFYREGVADRDVDAVAAAAAHAEQATGFHTGALALVPPDHRHALEALRQFRGRGVLCSVDVNMRPQIARSLGIASETYRQAALAAIGAADIVKVSDEDLRHLGYAGEPVAAARQLLSLGCVLVVLTLGEAGAWAIDGRHEIFHPAAKAIVVDTVGAGDTFFAGFIAALSRTTKEPLSAARAFTPAALRLALRHAAVCAAINVSRKGCDPPSWDEVVRAAPTHS
jgi:fructokinase